LSNIKIDDLVVLYAPGSCGTFLSSIFYKYRETHIDITVSARGDMHHVGISGIKSSHETAVSEFKERGKRVILIKFDQDDVDLIARLHYHKNIKPRWDDAKNMFIRCPIKQEMVDPIEEIKTWIIRWQHEVDSTLADKCFDFKTIFGISGNINQEVADFLQVEIDDSVGKLIAEYQNINKELYLNASKINNP
jgi:hypothetical protein